MTRYPARTKSVRVAAGRSLLLPRNRTRSATRPLPRLALLRNVTVTRYVQFDLRPAVLCESVRRRAVARSDTRPPLHAEGPVPTGVRTRPLIVKRYGARRSRR